MRRSWVLPARSGSPAGPATLAALEQIPRGERVLYARHEGRKGQTLSTIARSYGVSVSAIQQTNGMGRRTLIRVNQILRIPTSSAASTSGVVSGRGTTRLIMQSGKPIFALQ